MSGMEEYPIRLTRVIHIVVLLVLNLRSTCLLIGLLLNKFRAMPQILFDNCLSRAYLVLVFRDPPPYFNHFAKNMNKTLKRFDAIWFFLRSHMPWIIWRQTKVLVFKQPRMTTWKSSSSGVLTFTMNGCTSKEGLKESSWCGLPRCS